MINNNLSTIVELNTILDFWMVRF